MKIKRIVSAVSALSIAMSMGLFLPQSPVLATGSVEINETNFPDPAFRAYISENFDTGDIPGTLTESEIQAVTKIKVERMDITTLEGIGFFPNLTNLNCYHNDLTSIDLSGNPNIENLNIKWNWNITSIDLSGLTNLQTLEMSYTNISSLDLSGNPNLSDLSCSRCFELHTLDVSGMENLHSLYCWGSDITSINVTNCPSLYSLNVTNNHLTSLDLTGTDNIDQLYIAANDFSGIWTVSSNVIMMFDCWGTDIDAVDVREAPNLLHAYTDGTYRFVDLSDDPLRVDSYAEYMWTPEGSRIRGDLGIDHDTVIITTDEEYDAYIAAHSQPEVPEEPAESTENGGSTPAPSENETPVVPVGTDTPTPAPSAPTTAPAATTERGVAGFVERLYTVALGRASDPVGKQDWIDAITLRGETGASCARGFLYSPEFLNKGVSNEDFVTVLYRTFFDREPDQAGFNAWVAVLNNGTSKEEVIEGFINSTEWANLCLFYGIRSGGTGVPSVEMEPNQDTIDFATRLYTTCLGRSADEAGLMAWARQLANQRDTGSGAARGFFFSSEFTGQNVSNGEFVTRLYRTFMDREPDEAGFNAWVAQLDSGVSREAVFDGFAESIEFARICAQYGIVK